MLKNCYLFKAIWFLQQSIEVNWEFTSQDETEAEVSSLTFSVFPYKTAQNSN